MSFVPLLEKQNKSLFDKDFFPQKCNLLLSVVSSPPHVHPQLKPPRLQTQPFLSFLWTPSLSQRLSVSLFLSVCRSDSIVSKLGVTNGLPQSSQQLCESLQRPDYKPCLPGWMEAINRPVTTMAAHLTALTAEVEVINRDKCLMNSLYCGV